MNDNVELVRGLRDLADYVERYPDLIGSWHDIDINVFCDDKAALADAARQHGPVEKMFKSDKWFYLRKNFGPRVHIDFNITRDKVCRKEIVGKKTVVLPAEEAKLEREVVVEETRWVCDEPILTREESAAAARAEVEKLPVTEEVAMFSAELGGEAGGA